MWSNAQHFECPRARFETLDSNHHNAVFGQRQCPVEPLLAGARKRENEIHDAQKSVPSYIWGVWAEPQKLLYETFKTINTINLPHKWGQDRPNDLWGGVCSSSTELHWELLGSLWSHTRQQKLPPKSWHLAYEDDFGSMWQVSEIRQVNSNFPTVIVRSDNQTKWTSLGMFQVLRTEHESFYVIAAGFKTVFLIAVYMHWSVARMNVSFKFVCVA